LRIFDGKQIIAIESAATESNTVEISASAMLIQLDKDELEAATGAPDIDNDPEPLDTDEIQTVVGAPEVENHPSN